MYKLGQRVLICLVLSLALVPIKGYAADEREEIFTILQDAYTAQISLGEEERTMEEVKEVLDPYFTQAGEKLFLDENLYEENNVYFTLGTDNPFFYIPHFSYDDETQIEEINGDLYVYQFFPAVYEGPVTYEDRYDGVVLTKQDHMYKVSDFLYNIDPSQLPKKAEGEQTDQEVSLFQQLYPIMPIMAEAGINPFSNGLNSAYWWLTSEHQLLQTYSK
ncbi:DUF3993 domain-containing protein [Cytobacillus gottheilii]|uniref:DUF3993 domain-containing protein n=1 Tax=Cytobacillus gottheilii TaxID=859144 RepID=UPI0015936093|nr:DUF3993 domain-containing protein [Cytobacillus gottheilii]